jgi:N-acetylmuramoyl-L-alanine amidase
MSLSTRKKTILKQIYLENLRVAGKFIPKDIPAIPSAFKKFLFALLVMLPLAMISLSELELLIFTDESLPQADLAPKVLKLDHMSDFSTNEMTELTEFWKPSWDHLSFQIPTWSLDQTKGQRLDDYRLLVSKNDYTRLSSLFGLGIKTVIIDPGHGGKDPGAIGVKGTKEKDITLDVALRLEQKMIDLDRFNVLLTRQDDKFLTLAERVDFAKQKKADLFLSIHVNSLPNEGVNLIETYYFGPPLTSEIFRLAEEENKASQYPVSELVEIIRDINNTVKRQESKMLAGAIQASLYNHLSEKDPELINSGVKMAPFVVLSQIEVPSVLVEISCITNEEEEAKLMTSKYREKVASYVAEGVVTYLDINQFQTVNGEQRDE